MGLLGLTLGLIWCLSSAAITKGRVVLGLWPVCNLLPRYKVLSHFCRFAEVIFAFFAPWQQFCVLCALSSFPLEW